MKEVSPFSIIRPIQGEARREAPNTENAVGVFPILAFSPFGTPEAVRDFRPLPVAEEPVAQVQDETTEPDEGDVDPKAVTSSATDSAPDSGSASESTSMLMHPSTPSLEAESPASAEKESSPSSESLETPNDGWPLPLALGSAQGA
jgi:hypothetical protein